MREFKETHETAYPSGTVVYIQHDEVIAQRLPTTASQGELPKAVIPGKFLQPQSAHMTMLSYMDMVYNTNSAAMPTIMAIALDNGHIPPFCMWEDHLKGSAPPTVQTLAVPPTSSVVCHTATSHVLGIIYIGSMYWQS